VIRIRLEATQTEFSPPAGSGLCTIGRDAAANLRVDDAHVSAIHGQLVKVDGRWCYQDLGSTNGSAVERAGRLMSLAGPGQAPMPLQPGDRILVGSQEDPVGLVVTACEGAEVTTAQATLLAEVRLAPAAELADRLQAAGRGLGPLVALADALASSPDRAASLAAFAACAEEILSEADLVAVLEPDPSGVARALHLAAGRGPLDSPLLDEATLSDAVSVVQLPGRPTPAILAPVRAGSGRVLFALAQARRAEPAEADRDGLALSASLLGQRLAQLDLITQIETARAQLAVKNRYLRERAEQARPAELIGDGPAMRALKKDIAAVAVSDASVLITGPSGAGKELVAREIHRRSLRHAEIFAAVNCGALAEGLLESELFGHRKGAFTGAHRDREGLFEVAHGGTLFLDEIGEMSAGLQVKLLRVLETGELTPLGDTRPRRVDVRLLCATHRDLQTEVGAGRFREDLFYRVHVFPVRVPSLAERTEDIPVLARHLIDRLAARDGVAPARLSAEAVTVLTSRSWPGNVRQLANVLQRAMLLAAGGGCIEPAHLGDDDPLAKAAQAAGSGTLKDQLTRVERSLVQQCLAGCDGNRTRTARALGITRQALLAKLKKLGIT